MTGKAADRQSAGKIRDSMSHGDRVCTLPLAATCTSSVLKVLQALMRMHCRVARPSMREVLLIRSTGVFSVPLPRQLSIPSSA